MIKKSYLLLLVLIVSSPLIANYNFSVGGKNYQLVESMKSWEDAAAWAVQDGGYLVEINTASEQSGIWNALIASGLSSTYTSVNDGGGVAYVWIGGTDKNTEGTWLWDGDNDGQGLHFYTGQGQWGTGNGSANNGAYINWGGQHTGTSNEPDNFNNSQDAAAIALAPWPYAGTGNMAGEWNDINKTNLLYFIVEYDATPIKHVAQPELLPSVTLCQKPGGRIEIRAQEAIQSLSVYTSEGKLIHTGHGRGQTTYSYRHLQSEGFYILRLQLANSGLRSKKVYIKP